MSDNSGASKPGKGSLGEVGGAGNPVKRAEKERYDWPPAPDPNNVYVPKQRNPIQSILTALPVIMLVAGLYIYYSNESEQANNAPIFSETIETNGIFTGLSVIKSGAQGRHYLWFVENGASRGVRVKPSQARTLQVLKRGESITLKLAPTVSESKTYWAWYVEQAGQVVLNAQDKLQ